jgi:hypothetical protein
MNITSPKVFRQNRGRFPVDELRKYDGRWVAFSADGQRIVASGNNLVGLADHVRATGEKMQDVVVERIELEAQQIFLGGAELS